jgi:nitric oxide reductase subunit B
MEEKNVSIERLSPWWRNSVILVMVIGFAVLIWMTAETYRDAPPIPQKVQSSTGETIFSGEDILAGQQVFLKYGLMENGTIWGHGAYLGPDFSAEYLHTLAVDAGEMLAKQNYARSLSQLTPTETSAVNAEVHYLLKQNRYEPTTNTLIFTPSEVASYRNQIEKWTAYVSDPLVNRGLLVKHIKDQKEIQQLTAFFAWTAWASVANRPGKLHSYTNNFPYDPMIGNVPSSDACLPVECPESHHPASGNSHRSLFLWQIQFSRLERWRRTHSSPDASWNHNRKPEGNNKILCDRSRTLPGAGAGWGSDSPLPRGTG